MVFFSVVFFREVVDKGHRKDTIEVVNNPLANEILMIKLSIVDEHLVLPIENCVILMGIFVVGISHILAKLLIITNQRIDRQACADSVRLIGYLVKKNEEVTTISSIGGGFYVHMDNDVISNICVAFI